MNRWSTILAKQDLKMKSMNLSDCNCSPHRMYLPVCRLSKVDAIDSFSQASYNILRVHRQFRCSEDRLEGNVCAGIAHTGITQRLASTTLLIPDPFEVWCNCIVFLKLGQCPKQDADRMSATDGILGPLEVLGEVVVSGGTIRWWHCQEFHGFMV